MAACKLGAIIGLPSHTKLAHLETPSKRTGLALAWKGNTKIVLLSCRLSAPPRFLTPLHRNVNVKVDIPLLSSTPLSPIPPHSSSMPLPSGLLRPRLLVLVYSAVVYSAFVYVEPLLSTRLPLCPHLFSAPSTPPSMPPSSYLSYYVRQDCTPLC